MRRTSTHPHTRSGRAAPVALLVALVLGGQVGGCGSDDATSDRAEEASPSATSSPTSPPTTGTETGTGTKPDIKPDAGNDDWRLVEIVHATAAGGRTSSVPSPIGDAASRAEFTAQFTRGGLADEVDRVARTAQTRPGTTLVAAVVAIGCDVPPGVVFADGEVTPEKVAEPMKECFAPVTSVAVLEVAG